MKAGSGVPSPSLTAAEVHVWTVALDLSDALLAPLAEHLSPDERARAQRFVFARHQRRFAAGRGALRAILGGYLDRAPARLRFEYGPYGKPALAVSDAESGLRFNLSHSQGLAVVAVARHREIGVDVEEVRPLADAQPIATRCFSAEENRVFFSVPAAERLAVFFNCWTRKEAYLKALGDGLARPLDTFDVTLGAGEPARLLRVRGHEGEAARWSLRALEPAPGFVGALTVEGQDWTLASGAWPPEFESVEPLEQSAIRWGDLGPSRPSQTGGLA